MDQTARKINIAKFRANKTRVLIVTDVAARGIDLPLLDNVINCDFPSRPKLFVHRVGRVARAGRAGNAYSLVAADELAYMVDLNLFLGSDVTMYTPTSATSGPDPALPYFGSVPQDLLDSESEWVKSQISSSVELQGLERTMHNAYKLYYRTRIPPSPESVRRAKLLPDPAVHPMLLKQLDYAKHEHLDYLKALKKFRPTQTVFEAKMNTQGTSSVASEVMNKKRAFHESIIAKEAKLKRQKELGTSSATNSVEGALDGQFEHSQCDQPQPPAKRLRSALQKRKKTTNFVDENFFLNNFQSSNSYAEKGLAIKEQRGISSDAIFDVAPDEATEEQKRKQIVKWDRKDMRYKKHNKEKLKIDTKFYQQWTKTTHARIQKEGEQEVPYKFTHARQDLGLEDQVATVNAEVRQKYKNKQVKPTQLIKSQQLKKWKEKSKQDSKRQSRLHARQQKIKKGGVSFKAQHKHKGAQSSKNKRK